MTHEWMGREKVKLLSLIYFIFVVDWSRIYESKREKKIMSKYMNERLKKFLARWEGYWYEKPVESDDCIYIL